MKLLRKSKPTSHMPVYNLYQLTRLMVLALALSGCAVSAHTKLSSESSYDKVFTSAQQAAQSIGFAVTSSNKSDGFISANQAVVLGTGTHTVLNVQVSRSGKGALVEVSIIPPPGMMGDIGSIMKNFEDELRNRVPDIQVRSVS